MAPAHPHATSVAVYPALFNLEMRKINESNIKHFSNENKAGYTVMKSRAGGQGPYLRSLDHLGGSGGGKKKS